MIETSSLPKNPCANADQIEQERLALRIMARDDIQQTRAFIEVIWKNAVAYPLAAQMDRFQNMLDEFVCNFVLRALATDGNYPRPLRRGQPPHSWFGHSLPGSRWGGTSPNFIYRMIAFNGDARYELKSVPAGQAPNSVTYTMMEHMPSLKTLKTIESANLESDSEGATLITIGPEPADGRKNHIQTSPGSFHLVVRDALGDWMNETPYHLLVQRLDPPTRDPMSEDEIAQEAIRQMKESVYYVYYISQAGAGQAPNQLRLPQSSATFGGMASQIGARSTLELTPDEALIIHANRAGAGFRDAGLNDAFHLSLNYWSHTGNLNMTQMAPDEDGDFTYVVSHTDPGVHNWLDTGGLQRTSFGHRWQAFDRNPGDAGPIITTRVVKFDNLAKELNSGVCRIDSVGRAAQIDLRMAGFKRRFEEH